MPVPSSPDGSGSPDAPELMPIVRPSEVPTAPVASPSDVPTEPVAADPGDEPTEPVAASISPGSPRDPAPPAPAPPADPPPVVPAPAAPAPEKWAGRVVVPGATAPGQKKVTAPTEPTQHMARLESAPTALVPRAPGLSPPGYRPPVRRGRSRGRRALIALFALILLIAVPVTSAYVAYKLTAGENPFEWPPTVDYDKIFDR